jgi:hypothetical protein
VVESRLPKPLVAGSIPVSRSSGTLFGRCQAIAKICKFVVPLLRELLDQRERNHSFNGRGANDVRPGFNLRTAVDKRSKVDPLFDGDETAVVEPGDSLLGNELDDDVLYVDVNGVSDFDGEMAGSLPWFPLCPFDAAVSRMKERPVCPIDVGIPAHIKRSVRTDGVLDTVKSHIEI